MYQNLHFICFCYFAGIKEHSQKNHIDRFKKLCRLCSRRYMNCVQIKKGKSLEMLEISKDILILCHVKNGCDIADFHFPLICVKCITSILNINNLSSETTLNKLINSEKKTVNIWTTFSDSLNEEECRCALITTALTWELKTVKEQ